MPRIKNIIGQRFGMLTVLKEMDWGDATKVIITQTYCDVKEDKIFERCLNYKQYLCQCECGNKIIASSRNLNSMTSCGCQMKKNLDLTGMHFGKLTVLNKIDWKASKTIKEKKQLYKLFKYKTEKELKAEFPFLKEVPSTALQQARGDAEEAYKQFFSGKKGKPHFQKKTGWQSFRLNMLCVKPVQEFNQTVILPVIKEVKYRNSHLPKWFKQKGVKYQNITVSKTASNKYFASICCIYDSAEKKKSYSGSDNQTIGLDFSPKHCYINSNNNKAPNYIPVKQSLKCKVAHLQRELARRGLKRDSNNKPIHDKDGKLIIVGSKNREKTRLKLARLEEHIANKRRDYIEKETLRLVKSYEIIGLETLNIKGLMKSKNKEGKRIKHRNVRNYADVSWSRFNRTLDWKSTFHNSFVVNADKWFASSQLCNSCGYKFSGTKDLSCREWMCPQCGDVHKRDHNAALNLRNNAISFVKELNSTVGTTGDYKIAYACGEVGSRKTEISMKQEEINMSYFKESNCF